MLQLVVMIAALVCVLSVGGAAFAQEEGGGAGGGTGGDAEGAGARPASTSTCTLYGCNPNIGNPIQELAGMIVTCGAITIVLGGVTRRIIG